MCRIPAVESELQERAASHSQRPVAQHPWRLAGSEGTADVEPVSTRSASAAPRCAVSTWQLSTRRFIPVYLSTVKQHCPSALLILSGAEVAPSTRIAQEHKGK
jgi:hypothetical protein